MPTRIRTLIVDDSLLFRKILADLLKLIPEIEVVGQAPNGKIALQKIISLKPDLLVLDLDMPEISGLQVIETLKAEKSEIGIIIITGAAHSMQRAAIKALDFGAFELIAKPVSDTIEETRQMLEADLTSAIMAFNQRLRFRRDIKARKQTAVTEKALPESPKTIIQEPPPRAPFFADLIVIGISTGGPPALMKVFSQITALRVPIIIVQHIPASFSEALATSLKEKSGLNIREATDCMPLEEATAYIAPGGVHLALEKNKSDKNYRFRLINDKPVNNCKPSIDYLLETVIGNFSGKTAFFIMTGMGIDGLTGAKIVRNADGLVVAQNEATCVVYGMPKAVIEAGLAHEILSLSEISAKLQRLSLQNPNPALSMQS